MSDKEITHVDVKVLNFAEVKNWVERYAKPRNALRTTLKTHIVDPANADFKLVQICEYEPNRVRTIVHVIDAYVSLTLEVPVASPQLSVAAGPAPQGRYLPPSLDCPYVFYGPDAMWINSGAAVTRVTVTKEYC